MTEKRYYQRDFEELYYIIDSNVISEKEFDEKLMYDGYTAFEDSLTGEEIIELLNENAQLKSRVIQLETNVEKEIEINDSLHDIVSEYEKENNQLKERLIDCEQKKQAHKEMLMNSTAVVEQKKLQKIIYGMVIAIIDERIEAYERRPFSAPVSNPANPNYDPDVDRLARLSELQELRKEFEYD